MYENIKKTLSYYSETFFVALLFIQPLLDVMSYFMMQGGHNVFTTVLRTILLFAVSIYGFIISDDKRSHLLLYTVLASFWLIHALNCYRVGYQNPLLDTGEYLKLIQLPLWTFAFIAIFRNYEELNVSVSGVLVINICIIIFIILLSFLIKRPVYTYDYPDRNVQIGILGWFGIANAQSAILCLLVPFLFLWAFRQNNLAIFSIAVFIGLALLYLTGTRLTYYAAILICAAFIALIIWNREMLMFCAPLLIGIILLLVLRGVSPMAQRQALTADSFAIYQEKTDEVMDKDKDYEYDKSVPMTPEIEEKIREVYTEVYSGRGVYGNTLLGDLIDRFGVEKVMEVYDYSIKPKDLYDVRNKRLKCMELISHEQDVLTKIFGFEYTESYINGEIYDPENDFPALVGFYGYAGTILYAGFIIYLILISIRAFIEEFPDFLTMEFGTAAISFVLALGAAQFSGQVLRKPSVVVYIALCAAIMFTLVHKPVHAKNVKYRRPGVVQIKVL